MVLGDVFEENCVYALVASASSPSLPGIRAMASRNLAAAKWLAEEPEEPLPEDITEEEIKKREEEKAKKAQEETEEVTTVAKRKGYKMYLYGENFIKSQSL